MPLSQREQRILAAIEDEADRRDPDLAATLAGRTPPAPGRGLFPLSVVDTGSLLLMQALLLAALPLVEPVGMAVTGLITVALVVPWLARAARPAEHGRSGGHR